MAILYIVATPIGNLKDLTFRAIDALKGVDLILCEDTRVTKKLLARYKISAPTLSYHQHSKLKKINYIIQLLQGGKDLALVSDAGVPGIADPGNKLVEEVIKKLGDKVKISPIPGASAITAAASIAGFNMDKFVFLGFPPTKRKRNKFFEQVIASKYPVIFFESPHRILKTLKNLQTELSIRDTTYQGDRRINKYPNKDSVDKDSVVALPKIVVCRELTKKFETIYRGSPEQIITQLEKDKIKGEFVVIVSPKRFDK